MSTEAHLKILNDYLKDAEDILVVGSPGYIELYIDPTNSTPMITDYEMMPGYPISLHALEEPFSEGWPGHPVEIQGIKCGDDNAFIVKVGATMYFELYSGNSILANKGSAKWRIKGMPVQVSCQTNEAREES